jgi:hypothetical protein
VLTRGLAGPAAGATILALTGLLAPAAQAATAARPPHKAAGYPRTAAASLLRDLRQAWRTTKGKGVTVAVIGGTVDRSVAGLARKVVTGPAYGHPGSRQVTEGTLFASLVAGNGPSTQNPFGTIGIAPQARILSLGVRSTAKTTVWLANLSKAIQYAAGHGAQVIYVEQTSYSDSAGLAAAVAAAEAKNVVVASAEYGPAKVSADPEYPASLPGVLAAASVILPRWPVPPSKLPTPANGSILVAAPGNVLFASGPAGTNYPVYNFFAADAWLTATAALIKSAHPGLSPALVARALAASASYQPGGYRAATGFGLINPAGALAEAGKLTGLRTVAPLGPNAVAPSVRLASGPAPGAIAAVHHSVWKLAGYAAIMLAGLIVLLRARRLARRWRRRARLRTTQSHRIRPDVADTG